MRQRLYTFVSIAGITIGTAACVLMVQYVSFELSYDKFHQDSNGIYRVPEQNYLSGGKPDYIDACSPPALGPALQKDFPEVVGCVRLKPVYDGAILSYRDRAFKEEKLFYADSNFFSFFTFPLLAGNAASVLSRPGCVVLTEAAAGKYFGDRDPVGQIIRMDGSENLLVTGVAASLPENTHLKFQGLISMSTLGRREEEKGTLLRNNWEWYNFFSYIKLSGKADAERLANKLPAFTEKYKGESMRANNYKARFLLQPLEDIHLNTSMSYEVEKHTNRVQIYMLLIAAIFILVIAWINHVNFITAKALNRGKEVSLRKAIGALRWQLIGQFLLESVFLNLLACLLAIGLCYVVWPAFKEFTGKPMTFSLWLDSWPGMVLFSLLLSGILATALHAAFVLSSFKSAVSGKSNGSGIASGAGNALLTRKSLVVVQFALSVIVIAGTLIIQRQLKFMEDHDLGVNIGQKMIIPFPLLKDTVFNGKMQVFRDKLEAYPFVEQVSVSSAIPGQQIIDGTGDVERAGVKPASNTSYSLNWVDEHFLDIYNIKLIAGRNFSGKYDGESGSVIINQAAMKTLGFRGGDEAVGQKLLVRDDEKIIIGVVKDFHQESLKENIEPIVFMGDKRNLSYFTVQMSSGTGSVSGAGLTEGSISSGNSVEGTGDLPRLIATARQNFTVLFPGNPFEYFFLDSYFERQYKGDEQFKTVFQLFAILTIVIACLGLLGLAALSVTQRTREIGIRKVLGASITGLAALLARDFVKLVLIGVLLAAPLAWYLMNRWLQEFAYRINIEWWMLAVAGLLVVMIALLTVSFQSVKSALANPVKSLKVE